jgi:ATP-dependent phosphoenolpyruvate carboxykinase
MQRFNLQAHEFNLSEVYRNLPPGALYEHAIRYEKDASIAENGPLVAYCGAKTARSPRDKRVVEDVRASYMSAKKARHLDTDAKRTCKAARNKMTAALSQLARLHSQLPMSREAFATQIERIAASTRNPADA